MKRKYKSSQFIVHCSRFLGGQTLVEVIVGIAIAVMLTVSLISASIITSRTSRSAKNTTQATKLAEETIEQMRVFRDRAGYAALINTNCYLDSASFDPSSWNMSTAPCPELITFENITFKRQIAIVDNGADRKLVTVTISWDETSGTRTVKNETTLSLWDTLP